MLSWVLNLKYLLATLRDFISDSVSEMITWLRFTLAKKKRKLSIFRIILRELCNNTDNHKLPEEMTLLLQGIHFIWFSVT